MMDFDQDKIFKNLHVDISVKLQKKKNLKQLVFFLRIDYLQKGKMYTDNST